MNSTTAERILRIVLVCAGLAMTSAAVAVFMPRSWMAWCNDRAALPPLPEGPVTEYLARLTSGLYAIAGVLLLVLSRDVRRYGPAVVTVAVGLGVLSIVMIPLGRQAHMPWWWLIADAVTAAGMAVLVVFLRRRVGPNTE